MVAALIVTRFKLDCVLRSRRLQLHRLIRNLDAGMVALYVYMLSSQPVPFEWPLCSIASGQDLAQETSRDQAYLREFCFSFVTFTWCVVLQPLRLSLRGSAVAFVVGSPLALVFTVQTNLRHPCRAAVVATSQSSS